ncbi:hypothetical protein EDD11_004042 [Mortierella claussenii]|nr:hypothetical protein EDD11_004042 [Mortierella claussenii]
MSAQLDHASISRIGLHEPVSTLSSGLDHRPTVCSLSAAVIEKNEDELHVSGEDLVNTLGVSSERRKRSTGAGSSDGFSNARKRRSGRFEEHSRTLRPQSSAPSAASAIQHHDERWEQECLNVLHAKLLKQSEDASPKQNKTLDFDLSALVLSWSHPQQQSDHVSSCNASRRRGARRSRSYSGTGKKSANNNHSDVPCPYRRKRIFGEAIELSCPLSAGSQTSDHHPVWIESIKKRKVHQYPTKWTSSLSPAPYVKLMTIRDFWDVMEVQLDNGSLHFAPRNETENNLFTYPSVGVNLRKTTVSTAVSPTMASQVGDKDTTTLAIFKSSRSVTALKRDMHSQTTRQYPCPKPFLKGLWEEELRHQRERQMIPDTIRRPTRSKIFTSKPICQASNVNAKPTLPPLFTTAPTMLSSPSLPVDETPGGIARNQTQQPSQAVFKDFEMSLKKKQRTTAIIRSHGIAEGSDMSKYRPWKDGTILPSTGTLQELKQLRSNIMDPWPVEEAKSKDECTRVLHRMREQLNIVINLQIHLRSMIKTAPTQWSFLLSIRHPAQVSIELLLALYGPHFMQTSNFRAIEQLLWGTGADVKAAQVSQSESQLVADAPTSTEALLQV